MLVVTEAMAKKVSSTGINLSQLRSSIRQKVADTMPELEDPERFAPFIVDCVNYSADGIGAVHKIVFAAYVATKWGDGTQIQ